MKTCSKCKVEKDESEFFKDKWRKDGLKSNCKACESIRLPKPPKQTIEEKRAYRKGHYHRNKQKYIDRAASWAHRNIEKRRIICLQYNKRNVKKIREYNSKNYEKFRVIHRKSEAKGRQALTGSYLKKLLKQAGYTKEEIKEVSVLTDIKKTEIIIHRLKKHIKNKK